MEIIFGSPMKRDFFEEFNLRYKEDPYMREIVEVVLRSVIKTDDKSGINTTSDIWCGNCRDDCNYHRIEAAIRGLRYLKNSDIFLPIINGNKRISSENPKEND